MTVLPRCVRTDDIAHLWIRCLRYQQPLQGARAARARRDQRRNQLYKTERVRMQLVDSAIAIGFGVASRCVLPSS